jgi:broad specificity phosphatase PhoE
MKNKYIFLRHGETIKDPNTDVTEWTLTHDALNTLQKHIDNSKFLEVTKVVSSIEPKAITTAKPVANLLGLDIHTVSEFCEILREKKFLTDEEFLDQKKRELTNLDKIENGEESANDALKRFLSGIEKLESETSGETILVVSHGTVLTLYFAHLLNLLNTGELFSRWQKMGFCAVGKVHGGKVVEDIV